ncbi:MAG: phosphoglycerate dehydrogenase [Eggerthellales bacterium]|nr:phosphoglycerate dehydrogenase [Eggerthellales bacterium]
MSNKVLVSEKIADAGVEALRERGLAVDVRLGLSRDQLIDIIGEYDALVVRSATKVDAELLDAGKNLKVVGRAGVTVDNIDIAAATERGVIVCNAPTSNIVSAAEHTMALLLACARNIAAADKSMKAGEWRRNDFVGTELYQKTLAICGLGRVGRLVAERARAFGMDIVAYDPYCAADRAEQIGVRLYDSIDDILPIADFITVHMPKTPETQGMFGPEEFSKMKDGVILLNAACAGVYDIKSLSDFVAAGKIAAVGVDMWMSEPVSDSPLHEFDQATLTPHLGASTKEALNRAGVQIAEYVYLGLSGSLVPTALNIVASADDVVDTATSYIPACQILGSMALQMRGELPAKLKLTAAGTLADKDLDVLAAGVMDGMLSYRGNKRVTPADAFSVARRHGVDLQTFLVGESDEYSSKVSVNADGLTVSCTVSGDDQQPRIVELLGYRTQIDATGRTLIFEYVDGPGRMGIIGTVLGNAGVSINTMQIAKKAFSDMALVYMNVQQDVPAQVLQELRAKINPKNLWYIKL